MNKAISLPVVYPVTCHTDFVGPGSTFIAIQGQQADGVQFIEHAIQKGATKIVVIEDVFICEQLMQLIKKRGIRLERVKNTRKALADLSAHALSYPAKKLKIIGITGTKGKTTTAFLLEHILRSSGYKTALLSTVHNKIVDTIFPASLTTPQPDYLHVFFDACVKQGVEYVVMEVAAQALSLHRVDGVEFDGIIFTNFSSTHAEFYDTVDDYFAAKCLIFKQQKTNAPVIINADDRWCQKIIEKQRSLLARPDYSSKLYAKTNDCSFDYAQDKLRIRAIQKLNFVTFGIANNSHALITSIEEHKKGVLAAFSFDKTNISINIPLYGSFNAYNALSAVIMALKFAIPVKDIIISLEKFNGVRGRLEEYLLSNGARCFIDYAHNPSSYQAILSTLRYLTDHLIVVCGAGGNRDVFMRPKMGAIAAQIADIVVLTSDDPRNENPQHIVDDMIVGVDKQHIKKVRVELDREQAIRNAYTYANSSSIIVVLGKGHAQYQLINGIKHYFNEREIIQSL